MPEPMPTHPVTGLTAIGLRRNGAPIWPVIGGAENDSPPDPDGDDALDDEPVDGDEDQGDEKPDDADDLGDAGKKALDAMKAKWRKEREKRRAIEVELSQQRAPAAGDEPDVEAIRQQAEQAAVTKANERIVSAEVRAAAAGKLADPADALRFIDASQFEVDADGNVDADELADAIGELIKSKPYLAAQGGRRFQGTGDGGARKGSTPKQITSREDLAKMTPAERLNAHKQGRLRHLLQSE